MFLSPGGDDAQMLDSALVAIASGQGVEADIYRVMQRRYAQQALDFVANPWTADMLLVNRLLFKPYRALMHKLLRLSTLAWERRQIKSAWETGSREFRVLLACKGSMFQD